MLCLAGLVFIVNTGPLPSTLLCPQAFGQSFLQPDIHLFKQNLFYLETLNTKQKLYHKVGPS